MANYLHETLSKNVRDSGHTNEGIRTGVFPIHYELQINLKRTENQDDDDDGVFERCSFRISSLMCILSKKGETGKYEIMSQLEMDGISVNIQIIEKIFQNIDK